MWQYINICPVYICVELDFMLSNDVCNVGGIHCGLHTTDNLTGSFRLSSDIKFSQFKFV